MCGTQVGDGVTRLVRKHLKDPKRVKPPTCLRMSSQVLNIFLNLSFCLFPYPFKMIKGRAVLGKEELAQWHFNFFF